VVSQHARTQCSPSPAASKHYLRHGLIRKQTAHVFRLGSGRCDMFDSLHDLDDVRIRHLERLLFSTLGFWRNLKAFFSRVKNILDLLEQTLVLLELWVGLHGLLNE
jgi:hypothetical protein